MSGQAQKLKFLEDEPSLFEHQPLVKAVTVAQPAAPAPVSRAPLARTNKVIEKSPTAHRTISEVAEELNVPQHVLRFWETKFTQLRPLKRAGGRRYYRTEDVALIKHIYSLLYAQGYTIKGAQKVLKDKTARPVDKPVEAVVKAAPKVVAATDDAQHELRAMLAELKALRALV